jgi:Ribosome biogenesis protein SLX9
VIPICIMPKVSRAPKFRRGAGAPSPREQPKEREANKREDPDAFGSASVPPPDPKSKQSSSSTSATSLAQQASQPAPASAESSSKKRVDSSRGTAAATSPDDASGADTTLHGSLSRGQRKRQAKKDQYLRKEQLVMASLKLRHDDEQRKRIDGLDAIRNALLESVGVVAATSGAGNSAGEDPTASAAAPTSMLKTNHSKQRLVQREAAQMSLVLQHPAFQEDPFDAIRQHLRNTTATRTSAAATTAADSMSNKNNKSRAEHDAKEKRVRHRKHRVKATRSKSRR